MYITPALNQPIWRVTMYGKLKKSKVKLLLSEEINDRRCTKTEKKTYADSVARGRGGYI